MHPGWMSAHRVTDRVSSDFTSAIGVSSANFQATLGKFPNLIPARNPPHQIMALFSSLFASSACLAACRDRFLEPFASGSIWNTAIGSGAQFAPAGLFPTTREPTQFHNDQDFFLRVSSADPLTPWVNQGDWGGDDHCAIQGAGHVVTHINFPANWTSASDCELDGTACRSVG